MTTPAHVARVLEALESRGISAVRAADEPIRFDARCPCCPERLEIRDVTWQDRGRRVTLHCAEHDETAILDALKLPEQALYLADLRSARRALKGKRAAFVDKLEERYGVGLRNESAGLTRFPCPICGAGQRDWQLYRRGEIAFPWLPLVVPDERLPGCENCARLEEEGRRAA